MDAIPSNASPDLDSLNRLVQSEQILGFEQAGSSIVFLLKEIDKEVTLVYQLTATREGTAIYSGAKAEARFIPDVLPGLVGPGSLTVAPR